MSYNLNILSKNIKKMLNKSGFHNGMDVDASRTEGSATFILPSHNTIDALIKQTNKNPREATLRAFVDFYNKQFQAHITIDDLTTKELPCTIEYKSIVTSFYQGLYYCHFNVIHSQRDRVNLGLINLYIEDNVYKVRALLYLKNEKTLEDQRILAFIKDQTKTFKDFISIIPDLPEEENYHSYFEGTFDILDDFCRINLIRPDNYPISASKKQISIYLRHISEDIRLKQTSAIGTMISNGFSRALNVQRILLASSYKSPSDPLIRQLLSTTDISIQDDEDFGWYNHNH